MEIVLSESLINELLDLQQEYRGYELLLKRIFVWPQTRTPSGIQFGLQFSARFGGKQQNFELNNSTPITLEKENLIVEAVRKYINTHKTQD